MIKLGYKLTSEVHGPAGLVHGAVAAEQAGFDFAAISDPVFPWLDEQGHAPLAWSVLGAVAQSTCRIGLMMAVTCPSVRHHPAIVAQGAATVALLSRGRFTLGLGGDEPVTVAGAPGRIERQECLVEALDIIQGLLDGTLTHYRGRHLVLDRGRLIDRPDRKVPVVLAAGGPKAAGLAGEKADGLMATDADPGLVAAYGTAGGRGPRYCEVSVCWARSEDEAKQTAHKYFRWSGAGWPVMAELPDTEGFAAASATTTPDDIANVVSCGPSIDAHLSSVDKYIAAGFDHIVLTQIGPQQREFCEVFRRELAPALKQKKAA